MLILDDTENTVKPLPRRHFLTQLAAMMATISLPQLAFANEPGKKNGTPHCERRWRAD